MIRVQTEDVDIGALIAAAKEPGTGAVVVFDGVVRDDGITEMELEAYGDVAVAEMEKIAKEATEQFRLLHVDIIHRIGRLSVGENILIIVESAGHRQEAFAGSR
jgi:molybdopterin synthase catalytic subunit